MRHFAVMCVMFLLTGIALSLFTSPYTTGHGCAQPTPPGIPGSPAPAPAVSGVILINEVLLTPHSTWNCSEHGTYFASTDSWIELYNTQNQPYNLYAAHATITDATDSAFYYMPFGASIAAHGYLVLFPYASASLKETATPTLKLTIASITVDQVAVPLLGPDQSYARTADGASTWQISSMPTIDASNTSLLVTPTPTSVSSSSSSGRGEQGGFITPTRSPGKVLINGRQPQWSTMQFPPTSTVTTPVLLQSPPSSSLPMNNVALDTPRRIVLTILVIALAITLFWCWRLFRPS